MVDELAPAQDQVAVRIGAYDLAVGNLFGSNAINMTILFAALTAVFGMFALSRLPRPHHPVFGVPLFELASRNRFFLLILAHDDEFERERTALFLEELSSLTVTEVPNE